MTKAPIYLDYAATTPVDPRVFKAMQPYFMFDDGLFGNPLSMHYYGKKAFAAVETAREKMALSLHATARDIIFTSGATEANNLAIKGVALANAHRGKHIITSQIEHSSVLATCQYLETQGFMVSYLKPELSGLIELESIIDAITDETILVTLAHANSEIGVIQDIDQIGAALRERNILFHVDAAQSFGKIEIDLKAIPVDLLSLSAHKCYGPKGIGALYIREASQLTLTAQAHGGAHEQGYRSGTLPTPLIVGMAMAIELAVTEMNEEQQRIKALRDQLYNALKKYKHILINGDMTHRLTNNLNISVTGIDTEALHQALLPHIAFSSGSACSSRKLEPSYVLKALGRSDFEARNGVRLTLGKFTTAEDVDSLIGLFSKLIKCVGD